MNISLPIVLLLAVIQGLAELLPVSSSAHVILVQRLLGFDPSSPAMSFLLVMLHTGTMFAVILYFWKRWRNLWVSRELRMTFIRQLVIATAATGVLGLILKQILEKVVLEKMLGYPAAEIELLFRFLPAIAAALAVAGVYILYSGLKQKRNQNASKPTHPITNKDSLIIGLVQGLVLPFRGLSRSGMTISASLGQGNSQRDAEDFSFALAVVLTPAVLYHEYHRFMLAQSVTSGSSLSELLLPGMLGLVFSFFSGLVALKWLSSWLEKGRWYYFGIYCLVLAGVVLGINAIL